LETAKHLKRRDFGRKEDEEARAYFPYGKLSQRTFRPKEFFSGLCFLVSPRLSEEFFSEVLWEKVRFGANKSLCGVASIQLFIFLRR